MGTCEFKSLLPDSSTDLERSLEQVMRQKYDGVDIHMVQKLYDPLQCPEKFLPYLAEMESVDLWDDNWSEQRKREIIANSRDIHRHKGFYPAVKKAIESLGLNAEIVDWLEDEENIRLGCFRLEVNAAQAGLSTPKQQQNLLRYVDRAKRLSAHYDVVFYDHVGVYKKLSGALGEVITVKTKPIINDELVVKKKIMTGSLSAINDKQKPVTSEEKTIHHHASCYLLTTIIKKED